MICSATLQHSDWPQVVCPLGLICSAFASAPPSSLRNWGKQPRSYPTPSPCLTHLSRSLTSVWSHVPCAVRFARLTCKLLATPQPPEAGFLIGEGFIISSSWLFRLPSQVLAKSRSLPDICAARRSAIAPGRKMTPIHPRWLSGRRTRQPTYMRTRFSAIRL